MTPAGSTERRAHRSSAAALIWHAAPRGAGVLLVTVDAAAAVSDSFALERAGDDAYRVVAATPREHEGDTAHRVTTAASRPSSSRTSSAPRRSSNASAIVRGVSFSTLTSERSEVSSSSSAATRSTRPVTGSLRRSTAPTRAIRLGAVAISTAWAEPGLTTSERGSTPASLSASREGARDLPPHREQDRREGGRYGGDSRQPPTRELAAGAGGLGFTDRGETHAAGRVRSEAALLGSRGACPANGTHSSRRSRLDGDQAATGYPAGLTAREVDVLKLVAVGLSDAEVVEAPLPRAPGPSTPTSARSTARQASRSRAAAGRFAEENGLL